MAEVGHALVLVTCGSGDEARSISRRLVEERLAAGVQLVPIESVYRWGGEVVEDTEVLLIAKTRTDHFTGIRDLIEEIHSYEVPPIVMLPIGAANQPYLHWIDEATRPGRD